MTEFDKDSPVIDDQDEPPPTNEDCCNSGCSQCVFDIYQRRMEEKKKKGRKKDEECRNDLLSQTTFKPFILLKKSDFGGCYSRLTFQPIVSKSKIVKNDFENIILKGNRGFGNVVSRVTKGSDINQDETKKSGCMNFEDNIIVEENYTINEQQINGYLPYRPGQHLTMKSWRIENVKDQKNMGEPKIVINQDSLWNQNIIEVQNSADIKSEEESKVLDQRSLPCLESKEDILGSKDPNSITGGYKPIEVSRSQNSPSYSILKKGNMGTKTTDFIKIDQNLPTSSISKKAILVTETPNFITRDCKPITLSQKQNSPPFSILKEANTGTKTINFINIDQNSPPFTISKDNMGSKIPNFINTDQNSPQYSISKDIIGTKNPNFISLDQNLPTNSISKQAIMGIEKPNFITRDYTPVTLARSSSNCCFEIIIKYYEDGEMSKYFKSLKNGDIAYFRGPYGDFQYHKNHNHILAICMGTGVAPIYAIFRSILDDDNDETFIKLLYGCKDSNSIILRDEIGEMSKFWNFGAEFYLTSGDVGGAKFGENFRGGRIQKNCVYENLKQKQLVLVCGSETFNTEVVGYLAEFDGWKVEYFVF